MSEFREMMAQYGEVENRFNQLCAHYTMNSSATKRSSSMAVQPADQGPKVSQATMRQVNEDA